LSQRWPLNTGLTVYGLRSKSQDWLHSVCLGFIHNHLAHKQSKSNNYSRHKKRVEHVAFGNPHPVLEQEPKCDSVKLMGFQTSFSDIMLYRVYLAMIVAQTQNVSGDRHRLHK
jgi:hypothetical protein